MDSRICRVSKALNAALALCLACALVPFASARAAAAQTGDGQADKAGASLLSGITPEELAQLDETQCDGLIAVFDNRNDGFALFSESAEQDLEAVEERLVDALDEAGFELGAVTPADDGSVAALVEVAPDEPLDEAAARLCEVEGVVSVQPNYLYTIGDGETEDAVFGGAEVASDVSDEGADLLLAMPDDPYAVPPVYDNEEGAYFPNQYYLYYAGNIQIFENDSLTSGAAYRGSNFINGYPYVKKSSKRPVVAVLDSGCYYAHPDLQRNVLFNQGWDAYRCMTQGGSPYSTVRDVTREWPIAYSSSDGGDGNGHGTSVASIIAATSENGIGMAGATDNAVDVIPIKVTQGDGKGTSSFCISIALQRVAYLSAIKGVNIKVVNLSFGGDFNDTMLHDAIKTIRSRYGIIVVAAAGNDGTTTKYYPASYPEVIGVSGLDQFGHNWTGSNYNDAVDISAPGTAMLVAGNRLGAAYALKSGTSFSTPLVASAAALMYAAKPTATAAQVEAALKRAALPIDTSQYDRPANGSKGRLNAAEAIRVLLGVQGEDKADTPDYTLDSTLDFKSPFSDVATNAYYFEGVSELSRLGVIKGYANGTFAPNAQITRSELAVILYRYFGAGQSAPSRGFRDVPADTWYTAEVNWCADRGILRGYSGSNAFGPSDKADRQMFATVLFRLAEPAEPTQPQDVVSRLSDYGQIADWARDGMAWCYGSGVIDRLMPRDKITRGQVATMLWRAIEADLL